MGLMQRPDGSCLFGWPQETIRVSVAGRGWPELWISVADLVKVGAGVTRGRLLGIFGSKSPVRGDKDRNWAEVGGLRKEGISQSECSALRNPMSVEIEGQRESKTILRGRLGTRKRS